MHELAHTWCVIAFFLHNRHTEACMAPAIVLPKNFHTVNDILHMIHLFIGLFQLISLWNWLPERLTSVIPTLAYNSDEHGVSIRTFYNRSQAFEQSFLVVKTVEEDVFGAFCSHSWAERNFKDDKGARQAYFGGGESFLFRIQDQKCIKYPWVGLKGLEEGLTKAEKHARELFMCAKDDVIAVGGGDGNGLMIDSSLTFGKSERCLTFDNEPLCPNGDFKVAKVEVIGLRPLDI